MKQIYQQSMAKAKLYTPRQPSTKEKQELCVCENNQSDCCFPGFDAQMAKLPTFQEEKYEL